MAEARKLRIIQVLAGALALAAVVAGSALAQPVGIGSPSWSSLPPAEQQVLAPLAPGWDKLDSRIAMVLQEERSGVEIKVDAEDIKAALRRDPPI